MTESFPGELQEMDEEGNIACIAQDCAEGLKECLASGAIDQEMKREWLTTLLEAELADIEMGGIDLVPEATDTILEYADRQDWDVLAPYIRERLPQSDGWQRECLVGLLVAWERQHRHLEQAWSLVREMGTLEQKIFLKIDEGEPQEAVSMARQRTLPTPMTALVGQAILQP